MEYGNKSRNDIQHGRCTGRYNTRFQLHIIFPERNDQVKVPEVFEFTQLPLSDNPRLFLIMDIVPTLGVIVINVNGSDGLGLDADSWDTFAGTYVHLSIYVPQPSVRITRSHVRSIL